MGECVITVGVCMLVECMCVHGVFAGVSVSVLVDVCVCLYVRECVGGYVSVFICVWVHLCVSVLVDVSAC